MITNYLNQTATWYAKTGNNSDGEPTYGSGASIACRWEAKQRAVRTAQGIEIMSRNVCFCVENVQEQDLLIYDGRTHIVAQVEDQPNLDGSINHREVYTYEQG